MPLSKSERTRLGDDTSRDPCNCDDSTALANEVERLKLENAYMRKFMDASELAEMRRHLEREWELRMFGGPDCDGCAEETGSIDCGSLMYCAACFKALQREHCSNCEQLSDPGQLDPHGECPRCADEREDRRITREDAEVDPFEPRGAF